MTSWWILWYESVSLLIKACVQPQGAVTEMDPISRIFSSIDIHYSGTYLPIHPPSTVRISPLTYPLALLAKNTTLPLKSSGFPHRPAGILDKMLSALFSSLINAVFISVAMYPGAMALTQIPLEAHSLLNALVS